MRLRRITLENFRRHRHSEWEIPDGVTAVVGANGAGKSTLLEAIAFALYGPRATRTAKDLLRFSGAAPADSVIVALDFELAGQAWRIVRELRGRNQEPRGSLAIDGITQIPPGAGSSEQITNLVERALGLDRDGFFQTVVAQQGELDRLARMRPAERRSFVLGMVGIGAVDGAIARAREKRNLLKAQFDEASRTLQDAAVAEGRVHQAQAAHAQTIAAAASAKAARDKAATTLAVSRQSLDTQQTSATARQAAAADARLAEARSQQAAARVLDTIEQVQASRLAATRLTELLPHAALHDSLAAQYQAALQQEQAARLRSAGLARLAALQRECDALALQASSLPLLADPPALVPLEQAAASASDGRLRTAERLAAIEGQRAATRTRLERFDAIGAASACPTCDQPVTGEHLTQARAALAQQQDALATRAGQLRTEQQLAERIMAAADRAVADASLIDAAWRSETARRLAEGQRLESKRRALLDGEAALPPDSGPFSPSAELKVRLDAARQARDECLRLGAAAARLATLLETEASLLQEAEAARHALAAAAARLAILPDVGAAVEEWRSRVTAGEADARAAEQSFLGASLAERDAARNAAEAARELERDGAARLHAASVAHALASWTALAGTAGDGLLDRFKDHLIARTAPLIQEEASRLLSRFTQGKYTDVVVDDDYEVWVQDGGVRYAIDRFSGGEQDLVHLALRLAISRLLATRAHGAEIRLLALDEVFGSLDPSHRELVVAALHQLDGLYSQILAITHDEDLQEVLDHAVRIELVDGEARLSAH